MPDDPKPATSRRDFLARLTGGVGVTWLAGAWPAALDAATESRRATSAGQPTQYRVLTAQQAADFGAIADRIIPRDDAPGAVDVGVVFFVDQALATIAANKKPNFVKALAEANGAARKQARGATSFAALTVRQQNDALTSIERTDSFALLRTFTVSGYFTHPMHGGNRDRAGWKAIELEDRMQWTPPFGYYDRPDVLARLTPKRPS